MGNIREFFFTGAVFSSRHRAIKGRKKVFFFIKKGKAQRTLKGMSFAQQQLLLSLLASVILATASGAAGDVGTAAYYSSPYTPTDCYGDDPSQLPPNNLFAAAGSDLWDKGVACGRVYEVRCVAGSPSVPSNCADDRPIRIEIIDNALSSTSAAAASKQSVTGAELVLSEEAFKAIARPFADSIDVEFQEV